MFQLRKIVFVLLMMTGPAAAQTAAPQKPPKPKLELATEDGTLRFSPEGFIQPMFRLPIKPDADEQFEEMGFSLRRARAGFKVKAWNFVDLIVMADFNKGGAALVDYYVDTTFKDGAFAIRVGRFRPWLGRQQLMSSSKLQMVENAKAWADKDLGLKLDRDLGAGVFGMLFKGIEYNVGVWNGEQLFDNAATEADKTAGIPGNIDLLVGGRLALHPLSLFCAGDPLPIGEESDLGRSEKPALVLGVAALFDTRHNQTIDLGTDDAPAVTAYRDHQLKLGAELAFKYRGFSWSNELLMLKTWMADDNAAGVDDAVEAGAASASTFGSGMGAYSQLGYFLVAKRLEIAVRFDWVDENLDQDGSRIYPGLGLNTYFFGQSLKLFVQYTLNKPLGYAGDHKKYADNPMTHDLYLMLQAAF